MNLLLDTHAFLWFVADDLKLSEAAKALLEDADNALFLSIASIWEVGIKISIGQLELNSEFDTFFSRQLTTNQIQLLPVSIVHVSAVVHLPFHHRDPFDRLLIAQAKVENLNLISRDAAFDAYDIARLW